MASSTLSQTSLLKPLWLALVGPAWVVSLGFYLAIAAVRFVAMLSPYELQYLFFIQTVASWAAPFIFLTRSGRREIGISDLNPPLRMMLMSAGAGGMCALVFFALGMLLFGDSADNWCISIRSYLHLEEMRGVLSPAALFALYALPAVFLNPIGEELLFRGWMLEAFARRFNRAAGVAVSSILFALIYLYLHGIWRDASGYHHIRLLPASIAVLLTAGIGAVFSFCRIRSGSVWPAMAAHAAFNLTMLASAVVKFAR